MSKTVSVGKARPAAERVASPEPTGLYAASGERKYLNASERRRLFGVIERLSAEKRLFVLTLAWTGARISEVLALTPASFQVDEGLVTIRTLKRRRFSVREVPIPPELMRAVSKRIAMAVTEECIDSMTRCLWPWCRATGWRIVKRVMTEAGLSGVRATPRGLRHAFGIATIHAGIPLNLVQRWLGHARMSTTAIYTEALGPDQIALARRFWDNAR